MLTLSHGSYAALSTAFSTQGQLLPHIDGTPRKWRIWAAGPMQSTPKAVTTAPQQQQMEGWAKASRVPVYTPRTGKIQSPVQKRWHQGKLR